MEGIGTCPSGTVTFVFTDIEGSTVLWQRDPVAMRDALVRHDRLLRSVLASHGGYIFSTSGDAFCAAFAAPDDALAAAVEVQRAITSELWPEPTAIRVRAGVHTGTADERDGDYFGPSVNRAARIMGLALGGEVLASVATVELVRALGTEGLAFVDLGTSTLRGVGAEHLFGVTGPGLSVHYPPRRGKVVRLPSIATSTIGRDQEMLELVHALTDASLVTLVGPGGVGKTRLALEVAWAASEGFGDGTWWVELAPVRERDAVAHAFVAGLDLRPLPGRPPEEALVVGLAGQRRLVVVDNCEHVLDEAAAVIDDVVARCPTVTVLATSQAPLALAGERVWPVPPLHPGGPGTELFCERARAADATFTVGDAGPTITELCHRLDGMPLAIELAAARTRALSPHDLLARLDDRFRLLRSARRHTEDRHATLVATVDWSFQLLAPLEKVVFERLGVFAGANAFAAVAEVAGTAELDELDVLDALTVLVDHSLVVAERSGATTQYRLLDTMRAFARHRLLADGALDDAVARHVRWATRKVEELLGGVFGSDPAWFEAARQELDRFWPELRAAVRGAIEQEQVDLAVRLVGQFSWDALLSEREELSEWGVSVLALPGVLDHALARELLGSLALLDWRAGRYGQMEQRLELARSIPPPPGEALGTLELAEHIHRVVAGHVGAAADRLMAVLSGAAGPVSPSFAEMFPILLAQTECYRDEAQRALRVLDETPSPSNPVGTCFRHSIQGMALTDVDPAAAIAVLRETCSLAHATGATWITDPASNYLTAALVASGELSEAIATLQRVLDNVAIQGRVQSLGNAVRNAIVLLARVGSFEAAVVLSGWLGAQSVLIPGTARMTARADAALLEASAALAPDVTAAAERRGAAMGVADLVDFLSNELALAAAVC